MGDVDELVVVTRAWKAGACWYVEGRVFKDGRWLNAAFTAHAPDVETMTREEFQGFCKRQLPNVTEDIRWQEQVAV